MSVAESEILTRIIAPDDPSLDRKVAEAVLTFGFKPVDRDRMLGHRRQPEPPSCLDWITRHTDTLLIEPGEIDARLRTSRPRRRRCRRTAVRQRTPRYVESRYVGS